MWRQTLCSLKSSKSLLESSPRSPALYLCPRRHMRNPNGPRPHRTHYFGWPKLKALPDLTKPTWDGVENLVTEQERRAALIRELSPEESLKTQNIIEKVDEQISKRSYGRLFAVVHVEDAQRKVTTGDLLMINGDIGADIGDHIVLQKVVMVGGTDFTLIGRPALPSDLAQVEAVVVEKSLSKQEVVFKCKSRVTRGITNFKRYYQTTVRITGVDLLCPIEEAQDRVGFELRQQEDPALV